MTTAKTTITIDQIAALAIEASNAGDIATMRICNRAIAGSARARAAAARIIRAAAAMAD